ncbi:hypothetical protein BGZ75_003929 [Mortierella antarctica]|nr:hypothetical protein BGZ75_003929 [Mortierella antarctica]
MTMETSNDNNNPWSFQQHSQEEEEGQIDFPPHSLKLRLRRSSNDRRHLSFASTTTIAADATDEQYEKDLDFYAGPEYQPDSSLHDDDGRSTRQQPPYSQSWQYDSASGLDLRETGSREHPIRHHSSLSPSSSTSSHETSFSQRREASSEEVSVLSSSVDPVETTRADGLQETTLADSGVGLEGGVLDHQVQKLQSEVADTRAIVFHLESRLNAAENSNKHIVEELKILLADAEGTLVGSDDSDSEDSLIVNSKLGSGSDEDSNVVYNRICHALQTLISEAQTALNQGAGSSRSQGIFVQLYMLWKQTWLRKRIMHVLTGSVEVVLIVCIVLKISEISLEWIGFRMLKGLRPQQWLLSHLYGDGNSSVGAAATAAASFEAKELYEKILGDGLRLRQMDSWRQQESESLMKDYITSEVASGGPRTPFTAAGMVWRPAGRMIGHAVSGIVLAYLSDRARSIARKL